MHICKYQSRQGDQSIQRPQRQWWQQSDNWGIKPFTLMLLLSQPSTSQYATPVLNDAVLQGSQEVDELYHKLEMKRRELEEAQRQLLQERKKVEAFVGQDVQMLTVRPVDMAQMNPAALQAPGVQYAQQQQWQQGPPDASEMPGVAIMASQPVFQDAAPSSTPVTMGDNMGAPSEVMMMGADGAAVLEGEPSAKRSKLNEPMIPPPVAE